MWGWFFLVFLFFHSNDLLLKEQSYTGAYIVTVATQFVFTWICVVLHQEELSGSCAISGELFDWTSVSLVFGTIIWMAMLVLMMRYGTEQDHLSWQELEFEREHPGASKEREDGLSNRFSSVPRLQALVVMTPAQKQLHQERLRSLEELAERKRELAQPCRRSVKSGPKFRAAILFFLVDSVWGIYGAILAADTVGTDCADKVPRLVTLVTVMSIVFALAAGFTALAFTVVAFMRHCYCGIGEPGHVPLKARRGGLRAVSVASRMAGAASRARARLSSMRQPKETVASASEGDAEQT